MIVLAGENGFGKSTILDIIFEFTQLKFSSFNIGEVREIDVFLNLQEINSIRYPSGGIEALKQIESSKQITIGAESNVKGFAKYLIIDGIRLGSEKFFKCKDAKRILGSIYMDHNINNRNVSISTKIPDGSNWKGRRSSSKGFNSEIGIRERLLKIEEVENERRLSKRYYNHFREITDDDTEDILNEAIKKLVPDLTIHGLTSDKKRVMMKKRGRTFPFDKLSSGEKQILGITSYLTYDLGVSTGAIILIDEPENNLHPKVQLRLRNYFRVLFPKETQFIIATHSPFIIHDDLKKNEKVLVFSLLKQNIKVKDSGKYLSWDHQKEVNKAFQLEALFSKLDRTPVILVEGETDEKYLSEVKKLYFKQYDLRINWVGSYNSAGQAVFTGSSALDKVKDVMISNQDLLTNKLVLLYDCDVDNIASSINGKLITEKMTKNPLSTIMDKGVENGLMIPKHLDVNTFYSSKTIHKSYGNQTINKEFNKRQFCDFVCALPDNEKRSYFSFLAIELKRVIQKIYP